jgi:hypothetical protein
MDRNRLNYYKNRLIEEKNNLSYTIESMMEHGLRLSQSEEVDELSLSAYNRVFTVLKFSPRICAISSSFKSSKYLKLIMNL